MRVEVCVPEKAGVLAQGLPVPLAKKGTKWANTLLGSYTKDRGVYVIHHEGEIKYVGKTDRPGMDFGTRLRREFQETASQRRHIYPKLEALKVPPNIMVSFFPVEVINSFVSADGINLTNKGLIAIFEAVLIEAYKPVFQT